MKILVLISGRNCGCASLASPKSVLTTLIIVNYDGRSPLIAEAIQAKIERAQFW